MKKVLLAALFAVAAVAGVSAQSVPEKCSAAHGTTVGPVYNACLQAMSCRANCVANNNICKQDCCRNAGYQNVNGLCDK
jgi:hypothetical protein